MITTKVLPLFLMLLLATSCGIKNDGTNLNNSSTNIDSENMNNLTQNKIYNNTDYYFSVQYPSTHAPYIYQNPPPTQSIFAVYFTEIDESGKASEPDYGTITLFSISVKDSEIQHELSLYKNEKNINHYERIINNLQFTILEFDRPVLPGAKEYQTVQIAMVQNGKHLYSIEPDVSENIEQILQGFNLTK